MPKYLMILLLTSLSGCGMKGSLELPPGPPPEPLIGKFRSAPAQIPAAAPKDVSTDRNTSPQ